MKNAFFLLLCLSVGRLFAAERFDFVFCWGRVTDEASARAYAEVGVTDISASGEEAVAAAKKFGMRPYCGFGPVGPHSQVLNAGDQRHYDYINARDLQGKVPNDECERARNKRLTATRCQFGGEPVTSPDMCPEMIPCFLSDTNCAMSKARIDKTLRENPLAEGISFDYIGYVNFHSCECADCQLRVAAYLKEKRLDATEDNRDSYFREALVNYINTLVEYAKSVRPGLKVTIHLYPVFRPDPLYGRDLKADYIQQTVAWYFPWPDEKIIDYTKSIVTAKHMSGAVSVPFVGLNAGTGGALAHKSPERLETELKLILSAGGHSLGICNGGDMLKPGYREVFKKYAGR